MILDKEFWAALDKLVEQSDIVIDRPKGSRHPKYGYLYEFDYGYLKQTAAMDGGGIDLWLGSRAGKELDGFICTVDLMKKDAEIKLLLGCTAKEKERILRFHNATDVMKGIQINRWE